MEEVQETREAPRVVEHDAEPAAEPVVETASEIEPAEQDNPVLDIEPVAEVLTEPEPILEPQTEAVEPRIEESVTEEAVSADVIIAEAIEEPVQRDDESENLKANSEAVTYITDEPLAAEQIAGSIEQSVETEPEPQTGAEAVTEESTEESVSADVIIAEAIEEPVQRDDESAKLKAIIEAAIYITDEPLTAEQIAGAMEQPVEKVKEILRLLIADYAAPDRGLSIREVAGGYKMATKPEHHESIRQFVRGLQPPFKLSQAALETLAVVAYKQPITAPEIMEIRGVQGGGVLKTLLDRKLVAAAGRKDVLGKPILYKTTREFLIQFGLNSLAELPTLKEFEDLGRLALNDEEQTPAPEMVSAPQPPRMVKSEFTPESGSPEQIEIAALEPELSEEPIPELIPELIPEQVAVESAPAESTEEQHNEEQPTDA